MKTLLKDKKYLILIICSFLIPAFSVLIGFLAGSYAPFGPKNVLTTAGYNDYLPYFYELYDRIHSGQGFGYSTHSGLGYDFTSLATYYISDPLNFIILLFPRNSIISVLNILYIIKIGLSGSFMSLFLIYKKTILLDNNKEINNSNTENEEKKNKSNFVIGFQLIPDSAIIRFFMTFDWIILSLSIAYALSISMIGIGMNIAYTGSICIFPLVILGLDRLIQEDKPIMFIVFLTCSFYCNIHITIITIIFVSLYFTTRNYEKTISFLHSFKSYILSLLCSLLCSSIVIINSIIGGFFTENNSIYFPALTFDNPMNSFRQLMSQGILSYISMYGAYDIAITILAVFLVICYILQSGVKTSIKIKNFSLLIFVLSGTCVSTTRYLLNGFNLDARTNIQFSYIICFLFLMISYEELQYVHKLGSVKTIISFILSVTIIFSGMFFADSYDNSAMFIKTLEFLFGYFLVQIIFTSKSMTKTLYSLIISILLLIEIIVPNITNITNAGKYYMSQKLSNVHALQLYEAAKNIHEKEKDARVLIYNSSASHDTPLTSDLSGFDYIVSTSSSNPYGYISPIDIIESDNSVIKVNIFKPDTSLKHVYYPADIYRYNYDLQNPFYSTNHLSTQYYNEKNVFIPIEVNVEPSMAIDGSAASFAVSFDSVHKGHVYFNAYYTNHLCDASEQQQGMPIQAFPRSNNLNIKYSYSGAVLNQITYDSLLSTISDNAVETSSSQKSFDISIENPGYVSTCFSNIRSLKFTVNGKKVRPISIINNNALVPVDSGNNHIEIKYSYTGLIASIILSLLGIGITLLIYKKSKSSAETINSENLNDDSKIRKTIHNRIIFFIDDNRVYFISTVIVLAIFVFCQMITSSMPFGVYSIVKDDGIAQYFPWFIEYIDSIKNNNIFSPVSFNSGGFEDTFRYNISYNFNFAFGIPTFLLADYSFYMVFFTMYYILFLIFPVLSLIYYMTHKHGTKYDKHDRRLIVYSMLYALSSYTAVFFQYYVGFRLIAYLPILMLAFDQLIYNKKKAFYICILTLMMLDVYTCFLVCEFLALYFFTVEFDGIRDFFNKGIRFAVCSIASALLSAFNLIPFYYSTRISPYLKTDERTPSIFKSFVSYIKQIAEYHNGNALKTISDNNAQTASYCGLIMLFVVILYLINKDIPIKTRIKNITLLILMFVATNNELLNFVLHGFHFQTLAPNRFAIFIIFMLVNMLSDINLGKYLYTKKTFAISIIPISLVISLIYLYQYGVPSITIKISYALLFGYLIVAIYNIVKNENVQHYILYIAALDIFLNAIIIFPMNIGSKSDILDVAKKFNFIVSENTDMKNFEVNTEYITDSSAYKNIGKMTDMNSISFFDSAFTRDTMDYISYYNVATGSNSITYSSNPLADMMLRIKYHIVNENELESKSIYPTIYQNNEYELHENPNYFGLGFVNTINDNISDTDNIIDKKKYKNSFDYQNAIANYLGGNNIYKLLDCSYDYSPDKIYFTTEEAYVIDNIHSRGIRVVPITIHFPQKFNGNIYIDFGGNIKYLGTVNKYNSELSIDYPISTCLDVKKFKPCIASYVEESMTELSDKLNSNKLENISKKRNIIEVDANTNKNGIIYLSLPYYEGWDIYLDNQKVNKIHYLGGIGLKIPSGKHHVKMKYHSPYSNIGIVISILTVLIIFIYNVIYKKTSNIKKNKQ